MEKCLKYKYILTVIDLCTRYAFAIPLVNKSAESVCNAFSLIINESGRKCEKLWVDRGKEFYNKRFQQFLEDNDIILYSTKTGFHTTGNQEVEPKSWFAERLNLTLKRMMELQMTSQKLQGINKPLWIDVLLEIIAKYNNTIHSSIDMTPKEACVDEKW